MRLMLLLLTLLLAVPAGSAFAQTKPAAPAAPVVAASDETTLEDVRSQAKAGLITVRDWGLSALDEAKRMSGLSNEELFGVGVGVVAGLVVADFVGFGGLLTAATAVGGGYLGKWVVDAPVATK